MSELVVLGFDGMQAADAALSKLRSYKAAHLIDLEDSVVVERDAKGEIHLKQALSLPKLGAASGGLSGALWGGLVGLFFLNPLAGAVIGAGAGASAGALTGSLIDYGINDEFIEQLAATIPNESSALFILLRNAPLEQLAADLRQWQPRILNTTLSQAQETKLAQALQG